MSTGTEGGDLITAPADFQHCNERSLMGYIVMPHRTFSRAYADSEAGYRVVAYINRSKAGFCVSFDRFPAITDAVSGERITVDAADNFESLLELVRELVVECCEEEAERLRDTVRGELARAYRARMLA